MGLLLLGLEAPAFAAAPVVTSFSPTSGPAAGGCVVVVTGTALDDFATATISFESTTPATTTIDSAAAGDYVLASDTEAWVRAPALDSGAEYNIKFVNSGGTSTSTTAFLATAGAGGCAPTITKLTPACGSTNDKVVITGTNLLLDATPAAGGNDIAGGTVQFVTSGAYSTVATVFFPDSDTATTLTRFVSTGAGDGPVKVTAGGGAAFSTESFQVPPPDCPTLLPHARSISLSLRKHLVARGKVSASDGFTACVAAVPVKIQRRVSGHWKNVGSTTTSDTGAYKKRIKDKAGKYRAKAPKVTLTTGDVRAGATSPVRKVS
jgi:hypothetical protein